MFDIWANNRMEFSGEDKRECLDTAKMIVKLAGKVRSKGLLALEDEISYIRGADNIFLEKIINFMVDGYNHGYIKKTMQNYIVSGNCTGKKLFERIIITEGMLAILQGFSPKCVAEYLAAFFDGYFLDEFTEYCLYDKTVEKIKFREKIKGKQPLESAKPLDDIIIKSGNFVIQKIIRDTSPKDLLVSFSGFSENAVNRFIENMPESNAETLMEDYLFMVNIPEKDITAAHNKIMAKINEFSGIGMLGINQK